MQRNSRFGVADNILAALKHHDRVFQIDLWGLPSSQSNIKTIRGRDAGTIPRLTYLSSCGRIMNRSRSFLKSFLVR